MNEKLRNILNYSSESHNIDFKKEQYPLGKHTKKNEILKDISAMANHPSNEEKYIFIGVKEKDGVADEYFDIKELIDQSKYQQFVESCIEPRINFEYILFEHKGFNLACFIIKNNESRPYLFKKNIQNPENKNIEFKVGDGYIRTGTSTRKMNREDLENIYINRQKLNDRKEDLNINPYVRKITGIALTKYEFFYLDFTIENLSNKSISFDVELKIYYNESFNIIKRFDVEKKISNDSIFPYQGIPVSPLTDSTIFDLEIEYESDSVIVTRLKRINEANTIQIAQNDKEENIFFKEVLIEKKESCKIIMDMIVRSNDFTDGALKKRIEIEL